jgi:hypothetical protein
MINYVGSLRQSDGKGLRALVADVLRAYGFVSQRPVATGGGGDAAHAQLSAPLCAFLGG